MASIRHGLAAAASLGLAADVSASAAACSAAAPEDWQPCGPRRACLDTVDYVAECSHRRQQGQCCARDLYGETEALVIAKLTPPRGWHCKLHALVFCVCVFLGGGTEVGGSRVRFGSILTIKLSSRHVVSYCIYPCLVVFAIFSDLCSADLVPRHRDRGTTVHQVTVDCRSLPGQSEEYVLTHLRKALGATCDDTEHCSLRVRSGHGTTSQHEWSNAGVTCAG